jgi:hypothetical protein
MLFRQEMPWARILAFANAGSSIAARMAIIAITTSNSMRVNPETISDSFEYWGVDVGGIRCHATLLRPSFGCTVPLFQKV